jgi:hypothetical protein
MDSIVFGFHWEHGFSKQLWYQSPFEIHVPNVNKKLWESLFSYDCCADSAVAFLVGEA